MDGDACFVDHMHHFSAKVGAIGDVVGDPRTTNLCQHKVVVDITHVGAGSKGDVRSRLEESIPLNNTEKGPAAIILLQALKHLAYFAPR